MVLLPAAQNHQLSGGIADSYDHKFKKVYGKELCSSLSFLVEMAYYIAVFSDAIFHLLLLLVPWLTKEVWLGGSCHCLTEKELAIKTIDAESQPKQNTGVNK